MEQGRGDQPEHGREQDINEAGRRGGSAAYATTYAPTDETALYWAEAVTRWSPIWTGLLVAIGIDFVIDMLGLAISLSTAEVGVPGTVAADVLQTATIWSAIGGLVALFVGGFLAGRLGIHAGLRNGILQGTLVWTLYLLVSLLLGALGLAGLGVGLAGIFNLETIIAPDAAATPTAIAQALDTAATAAWWLVIGIVISWVAAAIGGVLGVRSATPDTVD